MERGLRQPGPGDELTEPLFTERSFTDNDAELDTEFEGADGGDRIEGGLGDDALRGGDGANNLDGGEGVDAATLGEFDFAIV